MRHPFLTALVFAVAIGRLSAAEPPAAWPEGWKKASRQFEAFIDAQKQYVPPSGLEFLDDGTVLIDLPGQKSLSMVYYQNGSQILVTGTDRAGRGDSLFPPGTYAANLQTTSLVGYQTLHPLVWFRVEKEAKSDRSAVRMATPPAPGEEAWPNERLLRFFDFHIFPDRHRDAIYKKNSRVSPDVVLAITPSGRIVREKLEPALEKFLQWRIYRDGRLVEKGPAGDDVSHALRESGSYLAFVGLDTSHGFLPVSNALYFPLFPTKSGGVEVFPAVTKSKGVPDFLFDILPPDGISQLLSHELAQGDDDYYYNKVFVYALNKDLQLEDPAKQALLSQWNAWSWELFTQRRGSEPRNDDLSPINIVKETN